MKHWTLLGIFLLLGFVSCTSSEESSNVEEIDAEAQPIAEKTSQTSLALSSVDPLISLTWDDLSDVSFEEKYYEDIDAWLLFPSFGDSVKMLADQDVFISGYVLTLEPGRYALSANPFSSCFFCGGAGPESVMSLGLVDSTQIFYTDEWKTFQGTLRLNDSDVDQLNYVLEQAIVKE